MTIPERPLVHPIAFEVKKFLENADDNNNKLKFHLVGRAALLGTGITALVEVVARVAVFLLAQIPCLLTAYQSPSLNRFIRQQFYHGFGAANIASATLFATLSPQFLLSFRFPEEALRVVVRPIREVPREIQLQAALITEAIKLPFQILSLSLQLPFYIIQLSINLMLLPLRLMLIPFQIALLPFTIQMRLSI
jgi:hypothetical protein